MKKILLCGGIILAFFGCSKDLERTNPLDPNSPNFVSNQVIEGRVFDSTTGIPIMNAQVSTEPATKTVMSNDTGNYQITDVKPGDYRLKVSAPYFVSFTSNIFTVTSTQKFVMDISMNPNIVFQDSFDPYTPALPPPNPPWVVDVSGGSAMVEVPPPPEQFTYGCKLYSGSTAGNYAKIIKTLPQGPAFKVVCKMLVDKNNSAAGEMRVALSDLSSVYNVEFGFAYSVDKLGVRYSTPAAGPVSDFPSGLSVSNYYIFIIEADNGSNTVNFSVKDKNNNQLYVKNNITIWSGPTLDFANFSAQIKCDIGAEDANGYIDDISIIRK